MFIVDSLTNLGPFLAQQYVDYTTALPLYIIEYSHIQKQCKRCL